MGYIAQEINFPFAVFHFLIAIYVHPRRYLSGELAEN
jgi:hypothetical protein